MDIVAVAMSPIICSKVGSPGPSLLPKTSAGTVCNAECYTTATVPLWFW
jgi:hypothetical protein